MGATTFHFDRARMIAADAGCHESSVFKDAPRSANAALTSVERIPDGRRPPRILGCASQGTGSNDEMRLRALLQAFDSEFVPFDRKRKSRSFVTCLRRIIGGNFDLFVLEGTGMAAGLAAIFGSMLLGRRYVFSSGDAAAAYLSMKFPLGTPIFALYERLLCRFSSGFIGWTPYLVGRSLTFGAKHGVTIPGWAPYAADPESVRSGRSEIRRELGIPDDAVVFGLVGSLNWAKNSQSCYGSELVRAAAKSGKDPYVLIVGDGSGLDRLKQMAGDALGRTIFMPGRVSRECVPRYLAAMDIGSLPQSVDNIGSFRYTTKISEYRDVGLPFVTSQIPMAYDLDRGDIWRLPGEGPWSGEYIDALAQLMREATPEQVAARRIAGTRSDEFEQSEQLRRATAFLLDILANVKS